MLVNIFYSVIGEVRKSLFWIPPRDEGRVEGAVLGRERRGGM